MKDDSSLTQLVVCTPSTVGEEKTVPPPSHSKRPFLKHRVFAKLVITASSWIFIALQNSAANLGGCD